MAGGMSELTGTRALHATRPCVRRPWTNPQMSRREARRGSGRPHLGLHAGSPSAAGVPPPLPWLSPCRKAPARSPRAPSTPWCLHVHRQLPPCLSPSSHVLGLSCRLPQPWPGHSLLLIAQASSRAPAPSPPVQQHGCTARPHLTSLSDAAVASQEPHPDPRLLPLPQGSPFATGAGATLGKHEAAQASPPPGEDSKAMVRPHKPPAHSSFQCLLWPFVSRPPPCPYSPASGPPLIL